jgi:hypothetical protein
MKDRWQKSIGWIFICGFSLAIANAWIAGPHAFGLGMHAVIGMTVFGALGVAMGILLVARRN